MRLAREAFSKDDALKTPEDWTKSRMCDGTGGAFKHFTLYDHFI
jgi:hypothetical protein